MKVNIINRTNPDTTFINANVPIDISYNSADAEVLGLASSTKLNYYSTKVRVEISTPSVSVSSAQTYFTPLYTMRLKYNAWKSLNREFTELS